MNVRFSITVVYIDEIFKRLACKLQEVQSSMVGYLFDWNIGQLGVKKTHLPFGPSMISGCQLMCTDYVSNCLVGFFCLLYFS